MAQYGTAIYGTDTYGSAATRIVDLVVQPRQLALIVPMRRIDFKAKTRDTAFIVKGRPK